MTDHHDFGDHHFDDDLPHFDEPGFPAAEEALSSWEDHHDDVPDFADHAEAGSEPPPAELAAQSEPDELAAPADVPDLAEEPVDVFPPTVDVGDLPEPVDGLPWIDSGSLGLADIAAAIQQADATEPVQPQELAEYAGTDLPPGADPWAALADSDDPATSALARWWSQN